MRLDDVRGFVFDVDGTLVRRFPDGVHPLPGAVEVLEAIRASGRPLAIFSNNSADTRSMADRPDTYSARRESRPKFSRRDFSSTAAGLALDGYLYCPSLWG